MHNQVLYIMGVAGSGKTTIGSKLAERSGIPFFDADDFHSDANRQKMQSGHPLNDDDRREWLIALNDLAKAEIHKKGAIIACSALKEKYRQVLVKDLDHVHFVFLHGGFDLIRERMKGRKDHFMPDTLLQSQFDSLEQPQDALHIDITMPVDAIVDEIWNSFFNAEEK